MERQKFSLTKFTRLALQNHSNCIQLPVEPPPRYAFTHMRVWRGNAAFWSKSSCYEVRNCPWGKPGANFSFEHIRLKISYIEVKALQESALSLQQRMLNYRAGNRNKEDQFVKTWDSVFGKTDYAWQKNPLVWIIYFEKSLEPNSLKANTIKASALKAKTRSLRAAAEQPSSFALAA